MPPPKPPAKKMPAAPVAPGPVIVNTLAPPGLVMRLHSDYDQSGATDSTAAEHFLRLIRPGAIILPNLDISDPSRVPSPPPADLIKAKLLDVDDKTVNGAIDQAQLTVAKIEEDLTGIASRAATVTLRIDPKDAARIRAFEALPVLFVSMLGPRNVMLGDGVAETETAGPAATMADPVYLIEAVTLAGDPTLPAPTGPSPVKANPFKAKLPSGSSGTPVFATRVPNDVWIEVVHKDSGGAERPRPRDVALFTIAPLLLLCGIQPAKRVYVVFIPGDFGNQHFVFDLAEGCQAVFGAGAVPLPPHPGAPFTPSTPAHTGPFYAIDGTKQLDPPDARGNRAMDIWIQDEMEIGYCFAPHASMHVVLHCKRNRGLERFVHEELAAPSVGVYDGIHAGNASSDSVHYGGNIEATPPVTVATPALAPGSAGPAVKAHRPAPFGKILLGDSKDRKVDNDFRTLLFAQHVQPVLPVDTSWLAVGHVDELISFVADTSAKGHKMLSASIGTMTVLLEEIVKVPVANGRTGFHRGKWAPSLFGRSTAPIAVYDEISVEGLLKIKTYNERLRNEKAIPIDQRLRAALHLDEADIIRVPTYFLRPPIPKPNLSDRGVRTAAHTVGMVNMLVLGTHLMIPKPFGPRLKVADAEDVLKRAFKRLKITNSLTLPSTGDVRWVEPGEDPERLVCYYTDAPTAADRKNLIDHIADSTVPLSASNAARVAVRAAEIAAAPANATNPVLISQLLPVISGSAFTVWLRITVPDDKVDVMEAYMLSVLGPLGVRVHFIDDWFYHSAVGEAHCATNALRELPETSDAKRWWNKYDPTVDLRYSP